MNDLCEVPGCVNEGVYWTPTPDRKKRLLLCFEHSSEGRFRCDFANCDSPSTNIVWTHFGYMELCQPHWLQWIKEKRAIEVINLDNLWNDPICFLDAENNEETQEKAASE